MIATQSLQRGFAGSDQRCRMRMPAMAGIQLGQRVRLQRFRLQFVQLVLQPGRTLGYVAAGEQGLAFIAQLAPAQCGFAHGILQPGMARVGIQQFGLCRP